MTIREEVDAKAPREVLQLLERRDVVGPLVDKLNELYPPATIAQGDSLRIWELCGLYFKEAGRLHEALAIFEALYRQLLQRQRATDTHFGKGLPLVWMSDCHARLGHPVLAKRYLMLTACEDAVTGRGVIDPETTGAYFRAVWVSGIPHQQLAQYAKRVWELTEKHPQRARFPEWLLQELDQDWMLEYPSPAEAGLYFANHLYIESLLQGLASGDGSALERLAHYFVSAIPGCRAYKNQRTPSTEYDVVGVFEGAELDFRSELGRYFVVECKDWAEPVGFASFAKLCRVLDSVKCRLGLLFSREGITGEKRTVGARREQLKVFQDRGIVIIVVSEADLRAIAAGMNFITMLRTKYEAVRLDLQ